MDAPAPPPNCPRCAQAPKFPYFSAVARHALEDGSPGPVVAALYCAVCFCGTWVWRGAWSSPGER